MNYCKSIVKRFQPRLAPKLNYSGTLVVLFYVDSKECAPFARDLDEALIKKDFPPDVIEERFNRWLIKMIKRYHDDKIIHSMYHL